MAYIYGPESPGKVANISHYMIVGSDEKDPVCVLWSRRCLKERVLSQLTRNLRENILGYVQAFVESIYYGVYC